MAQHEVKMTAKISQILNKDVSFKAYADGELVGELLISKGALEWRPTGNSVSTAHFPWAKFADVMKPHVKKR